MNFNTNIQLGARFKLATHKGDGEYRESTGWFLNTVLDSGLDRMSVGTWIDRVCVGTGSTPPDKSQTALDTFLASTSKVQINYAGACQFTSKPYYHSVSRVYRFAAGAAAGNLTEVGLGWSDTALWNRTLIKDVLGEPTVLTVLEDEFLDVLVEVRVYFQDEVSGSFNLLNRKGDVLSTHKYTGIPCGINSTWRASKVYVGAVNEYLSNVYAGSIGTSHTAEPTGTRANPSSVQYSNTARSASCRVVFGLNAANFPHKSFRIGYAGLMSAGVYGDWLGYKFELDVPIPKNNTQEIAYNFTISWDRYGGTD